MASSPSKRSKRETRRLKAEIRSYLADGASDREISGELGITIRDVRNLKRELISDELEQITNDSAEEVWAKYRIRMDGCIADLDDVIEKAVRGKELPKGGLNAAVGAIKAKASILDSVLKKGQELGVLHKEPDRKVVISGVAVASVELEELRELVDSRRADVEDLVTSYAPKELVDYADEPEGDLYAEPALERIPERRKAVSE